jgi:hypothetical protein
MSLIATVLMTAAAAAVASDPIEDCRAAHAGKAAEHIACLEDALRGRAAAAGPAPAASVPAAATAAPAAAAEQASPQPTGLGAEQAIARQAPPDALPEQVEVRIVSVRYTKTGLGVFMMSDGQVWQETEAAPEYRRLQPGREYDARIKRGMVSGYRLYVAGGSWMHKVRRLQ